MSNLQLANGGKTTEAGSKSEEQSSKSDSDWQSSMSLLESHAFMLDQQLSCDVTFDAGNGDDRKEIGAHKYVLMSRSCVFYEMFQGHMTEKGFIRVEDVEPTILMKMLKYMYTEEFDIEFDLAFPLLHSAKKYRITNLIEMCNSFLVDHMTPENACQILEGAHKIDEKDLFEKAHLQILENGDISLQSPGFKDLCVDCVEKVASSDDLVVTNEELVLNALKDRALGIPGNGESGLREALGELLHLIRFPLISATYFRDHVMNTGVLSLAEEKEVLEQYIFPREDAKFCCKVRKVKNETKEVWRIPEKSQGKSKAYDGVAVDAIAFTTAKNVLLHGFRIWAGTDKPFTLSYSLYCVFDTEHTSLCRGTHVFENWLSDLSPLLFEASWSSDDSFDSSDSSSIVNNSSSTYIVDLPKVVRLNRWMKYVIELVIEKECESHYSTHPTCADTYTSGHITFMNSERDTNGTNVKTGQIPCLICSFP